MRWLEEFKKLIDNEFPSDWIESLIGEETTIDVFEKALETKEFSLLPDLYKYINYSILEGEFVNNPNDFLEIITDVFSKISNIQNPTISIEKDPKDNFISVLIEYKFFYSIKKSLELYKRIAIRISTLIYNPEKTFVIEFASTSSFEGYAEYFKKKSNVIEEPLFDLVYENLVLAEEGFFLNNNDGQFFELLKKIDTFKSLKTKISETTFQEIIDVLIEICVFYQRKLIIRKYQDDEKFDQKYLYEQNETSFNLDEHKLSKGFLKSWDAYSQKHYLSEKNQERTIQLKRDVESKLKNDNFESFLTTHLLIKYYKDINYSKEKLANFKDYFNLINPSEFDKYAVNVSLGYFLNNQLSKKLEDINEKDFDNLIMEISKHQEKCSINNYFPYYKISKFLKKRIEHKFDELKKNNVDDFKVIDDDIARLKKIFNLFKLKFKWSKTHLSYAYQLPFNECISLTKIVTDEINVFIPSTFSLPLNYDKYDGFSDKMNNFLLFCENELKSLENYYFLNEKINEKEKEISGILKDQAKKNIELLGIFSAIIALLFQGAYTVNSDVEFEDKLFTLIAMFLVLISFMLMLRSFYSKKFESDELKTIKIISFLVIPILLITTIILFKIFK